MNQENLWAPWRMAYLRELTRRAEALTTPGAKPGPAPDFLADYWGDPAADEANHVVYRNDQGLVLLNRYPYANGHLLVALGEARPTLMEYDASARAAFWSLVETAMTLMQHTLNPQGINVGVNQGSAAGAGVPEHLHAHVVPRWSADTNFMTVTGQVRVIPDALEAMAAAYRRGRNELDSI